jgi:hypothetical protein
MAHQSTSEKFGEALFELLQNAPDKHADELVEIIKTFRETYARSYRDVKRQPFARNIIEAVEEYERFQNAMRA